MAPSVFAMMSAVVSDSPCPARVSFHDRNVFFNHFFFPPLFASSLQSLPSLSEINRILSVYRYYFFILSVVIIPALYYEWISKTFFTFDFCAESLFNSCCSSSLLVVIRMTILFPGQSVVSKSQDLPVIPDPVMLYLSLIFNFISDKIHD